MMGGWLGGSGCCGFGSYGVLGGILSLVLLAALVVGLVLLVKWVANKSVGDRSLVKNRTQAGESAEEILQKRYARGEITQEEYREIRSDLA